MKSVRSLRLGDEVTVHSCDDKVGVVIDVCTKKETAHYDIKVKLPDGEVLVLSNGEFTIRNQ